MLATMHGHAFIAWHVLSFTWPGPTRHATCDTLFVQMHGKWDIACMQATQTDEGLHGVCARHRPWHGLLRLCAGLAGVLLLLLIGSDSNTTYAVALKHAASVAYNWVELLVGVLMWKYPTLQPQRHFRSLLPAIKGTPGLVNRQCNEEFLAFFEEVREPVLHYPDPVAGQ